jgi:hypothetical protein
MYSPPSGHLLDQGAAIDLALRRGEMTLPPIVYSNIEWVEESASQMSLTARIEGIQI